MPGKALYRGNDIDGVQSQSLAHTEISGLRITEDRPWVGGMTQCHLQAKKKLNLGDTWTVAICPQSCPDTSLSCAAVFKCTQTSLQLHLSGWGGQSGAAGKVSERLCSAIPLKLDRDGIKAGLDGRGSPGTLFHESHTACPIYPHLQDC